MHLDEQVKSWIDWSQRNLPQTGDIPKLNNRTPLPPWIEDFPGTLAAATTAREQLLATLTERLIADPVDIPSRYTALRLYSCLSGLFCEDADCIADVTDFFKSEKGLDPAEIEMVRNPDNEEMLEATGWYEEKASGLMNSFKNDFCLLVRQLKVEEVPCDWRFVRWEILNSYAICDWDRARKLISKAEEEDLLEPQAIHGLRGHFLYLRVFGPRMGIGLDTLYWEPVGGRESFLVLMHSGFAAPEAKKPLTDQERDALREATLDLERCVEEAPELYVLFGSQLARCYLETGHLHDAAAQYERFLRAELLSSLPQWKVEVYKRLSAIYEKIGDTEEAIEYLARCASEFAKEPGIHRKMAEMLVDRGDYRSAYECLLKETEVTPDLEKDLGVRVALALGALQDSSDRSDQASKFLDSHPPIKSLIDSMLTAYWPRFAKLGSQSQSEWRSGICEMYVFAPLVPEDRCRRDENAVKHFAKVVELELRTRVFDEYRKQFPGGNRDLNLPSPGRDQWLRNLDHFLAGRGQLNLEKMTNILVSLSYSRDPVAQRFQAWLQQKSRRLLMKVQVLEQICKPRGDATHKEMTSNVAESVAQWCREILDSLLSVSP